jgi:hypothetical protein
MRGGCAPRTSPNPPGLRAGATSRGVTTPVPRVYLPLSLTTPGSSGSTEPTRLCRGCSHRHRRSTAPAASSSTPPLRRRGDGRSLTSIWTSAPRGALEQVAGQDRVRLCPEKLRSRGTCSAGRGVDPGCVQELPDGGGADLVAEVGELAGCGGSPRSGSRWPDGGPGHAGRRGWRVDRLGWAGWSSSGRSAVGASAGSSTV